MRTFSAGFNAILAGGACYWLVVIKPNTSDTFTQMAFGTIPTASLAGYDVKAGRLVDISDIEQSIDVYKETFAKTPSVSIEIYNTDGNITQNNLVGRTVEIRMGYGTTMSILTSEVFFTGKINAIDKNDLHKIKIECIGTLKQFDTEIGYFVPDAYQEDAGKIYPIVNGVWSDDFAFCPIVMASSNVLYYYYGIAGYLPDSASLWFYDKTSKRGYQFISGNSDELDNVIDGKILKAVASFPLVRYVLDSVNYNNKMVEISETVYNDIDIASKSYCLMVDNEILPLIAKTTKTLYNVDTPYTGYVLWCARAAYDSVLASHAIGTTVKIIDMGGAINRKASTEIGLSIKTAKNFGQMPLAYPFLGSLPGTFIGLGMLFGGNQILTIGHRTVASNPKYTGFIFSPSCDSVLSTDFNVASAKVRFIGTYNKVTDSTGGNVASAAIGFNIAYADKGGSYLSPTLYTTDPDQELPFDEELEVSGFDSTSLESFLGGLTINPFVARGTFSAPHQVMTLILKIISIEIKVLFQADLTSVKMYARNTGRKIAINYFNDLADTLVTNPSSIVEDFCRTSVPSMSYLNLDETSFDAYYTDRADWKIATAIYSGVDL